MDVKSILYDYTTLLLVPLLSLMMLCEYWVFFKSEDVKPPLFRCSENCHINHTTCGLEAYQTCQTQKVISYTYFASSSQSDRNSFQIFLTKQVSEHKCLGTHFCNHYISVTMCTWPAQFCPLVYCPGRWPTVCRNRLGHQNSYFWGC